MNYRLLMYGACLSGLALSGCVAIPANRGADTVMDLLESRSTAPPSPLRPADRERDELIDTLVSTPLDASGAVRLALLNNQRINQLYAQLGLAQADVYDASRLSNPSLGHAYLSGGGAHKTTWSISQRFTELLFLRLNTRIARSALLQTQQHVAQEILLLEADVRKAWYRMASEQLNAQVAARVASAAQAAAEYAQSLYDAGNISELQLKRELSAAAQVQRQRRQIDSDAVAARGALLNLLGISFADTRIHFADQMMLPSVVLPDVPTLQQQALRQRLDISATRAAVEQWQWNLRHTRRWRWFHGVELGIERERDGNDAAMTGPTASVELPLFNQGGGALTRANAQVESLTAQLRQLELEAGNDIVVQLAAVNAAAATVDTYRQQLIPLQQRIVALTQQQHSYMLIGTFELLAARQAEFTLYQDYVHALRDYWIALTELARINGDHRSLLTSGTESALSVLDSRAGASARPAEMDHAMQGMQHDMQKDDAPASDHAHHDHASHPGVTP